MTPRAYRAFCGLALLGLAVILVLHLQAWNGIPHPRVEWPIRISTFAVFGAAYFLTPSNLRNRLWSVAVSAVPKWVLVVAVLVWCYWLASLVYFTMWDLPARGTAAWYQAFTGRFIIGWVFAALVFFVDSRVAGAPHARGASR